MKSVIKIIYLFVIAGLIGFSINFTFSFEQNSITFVYAALIYAVTGFVQQKRNIRLINFENVLLFWYILLLILYAGIINPSWDLPVLLCLCIVGFFAGYYSALFWKKNHTGKLIATGWIIGVALFNLVFIPWLTFSKAKDSSLANSKPEYKLFDLKQKNEITSAGLKGKTVFLDFWFINCGACRRSFPKVQELYDKYKNDPDVRIYIVNCGADSLSEVNEFIAEENIKIPVLYDTGGKLTKELEVNGFPFHIIIDRKGVVKFNHLGYNKDEAAVFVNNMIEEIEKVKN